MTGLLEGRRLLVTGVLTERSIAYSVARRRREFGVRLAFGPTEFTQVNAGVNRVLVKRAFDLLVGAPRVVEFETDYFGELFAKGLR